LKDVVSKKQKAGTQVRREMKTGMQEDEQGKKKKSQLLDLAQRS